MRTDGTAPAEVLAVPAGDLSRSLAYLLVPLRDQYVAIMDVLTSCVDDLSPGEISETVAPSFPGMTVQLVAQRLKDLDGKYRVVSGHPDSDLRRFEELDGTRWRWSATPVGREVHRFYQDVLRERDCGQREIPLPSLRNITDALTTLAGRSSLGPEETAALVSQVFVSHDDLDSALTGAADALISLARRFDLSQSDTAELKSMLLGYATHVVAEVEHGVARAHRLLCLLGPRFTDLAATCRSASRAQALVGKGLLTASRGSRPQDWQQLTEWFDPLRGKAARFSLRVVAAIPAMHANLRRLQGLTSGGTVRARALHLAAASANPQTGPQITAAALADHPWRKLHTRAPEAAQGSSWHDGPHVPLPSLLRTTGQMKPRGPVTRARQDTAEREAVEREVEAHARQQAQAISEVLSGIRPLSAPAARAALAAVVAAAGAPARAADGVRTGAHAGLGCSLLPTPDNQGRLRGANWSLALPGQIAVFHRPKQPPTPQQLQVFGRRNAEPQPAKAVS
ncbi:DUF2397 family protein [Streptomyces sp. NPDC057445]|uniref:DUF2397 family protein n=1 Tax=Streptomyces sp. NPDC057445 TaxID=3346136 RepID=UPI0036C7BA0B